MPEAVIVDAIRTPIGRAGKGSLKSVRADDLAAIPLKALIERNPELDQGSIGDIMMGCGFCEGEQGYNVGRVAGLLAGIDHHVPACTVNRFCASSLQTTRMAFHAIKMGEGDTYIAAGVEAVSRAGGGAPFEFNHAVDGSEGAAYNVYIPMGMTAENVAERCNVSREAQDEWAVISQTRAVEAVASGHFDSEIVPVTVPAHKDVDKEGNEIDVPETVVSKDDGPRPGTTMEKLAALKPVFKEGGTVTAGNACPLNDGAAALLIMSEEKASLARLPAARADRRLDRRRDPPGDHGPRPDPGDPAAAEEHRHGDRATSTWSRSTRRSPRRSCRAKRSSESTTRSSTRSAARSRSGTRSA